VTRARADRLLPLVAAAVALLGNPGAAVPSLTYWFRDFTVTFYPLRALAARELAEGRIAWWNPYVNEGAFMLPVLYPLDLLHGLLPGPVAASWLLTLHLPLAALAAYALARDLGTPPPGALAAGIVFGAGGLTVSSLNLYVFLQALALAPLVVLTLRRAAREGGRWIAAAAAVLALSLSTMAVEFVIQAVALGLVTAWADGLSTRGAGRLAHAGLAGAALAAVPLMTVAAVLPETVRGAGFDRAIALGNELHPAALLQALVPRLFGDPADPVDAWWGGRFFTKGFPYFLTLYAGALAPALAAAGIAGVPRRRRIAWLAASGLAVWYALGARGGLATVVAAIPGMDFFRFPVKALLLPFLVLALTCGAGAARLATGRGWRGFGLASAAILALGLAVALGAGPLSAVLVAGATPTVGVPAIAGAIAADGAWLAGLAATGVLLSLGVQQGRVPAAAAAGIALGVLASDLVRAAHGINPQAPAAFYAPLPEMKALGLDDAGGGRTFTYGLDGSPAFRRFLVFSGPGRGLWSFFLSRQALAPYANLLDGVAIAEGKDLTGFVLHPLVLEGEDLDPGRVGAILPRLREAAVARVVSLDPLDHPDLALLARVAAGPPGLAIHVYAVRDPWPRASLSCGAGCAVAAAVRSRPGEVAVEVEAPAPGSLLVRDNFAAGWTAAVDGQPAEVRAAGRYMTVDVSAGRHSVLFRYRPPRLDAALLLTACGAAAALAGARRRRGAKGYPLAVKVEGGEAGP
jgi:hypothetical protein